ncbi:MAG: glycosyltransferase family 2 protein, partial [Candidatus Nanohaloarchaea archaeon]
TVDIVQQKQEEYGGIELVEEGGREGQSAAQNKILDRVENDAVFLIDGDGVFTPGSMEAMMDAYDGDSLVYGREYPVLGDTFGQRVMAEFWKVHDALGRLTPAFTTQIALIPTDLVDRIPPEIVIDDEYLGQRAREEGRDIIYVPEAVKLHNIKGDVKSFLRHRRKNWAGMIQIQRQGYDNLQPTGLKLKFFLRYLFNSAPRSMLRLLVVGWIEFVALTLAYYDSVRGRWPYIWDR